jgi:agmatinase
MIDPMRRWRDAGEKPDYAGLVTFAALPYTEDPAELAGVDVAVVGAPMDELVSERPGTRLGPRAIRVASTMPGRHLSARVDAMAQLRVVDYGDAAVLPADPTASHAAIERSVGEVLAAGALPLVLGGDHSIAEPEIRAVAAAHGAVGVIQFDAHTDTATKCFGVGLSHGTPFRTLVDEGLVDPRRYVQIGLRGYWPDEATFAWQRERGITSLFMHDVAARGIGAVLDDAVAAVGAGPLVLTIDVDALDPAFAPGTGTPEPGGMTSLDLLWACREVAARCELVAADVVEVCPSEIGAADITALVGSRLAHEVLTGLAMRRRAADAALSTTTAAAADSVSAR